MEETTRLIARVRRRLFLLRAFHRFQRDALYGTALVLAAAIGVRVAEWQVPVTTWVLVSLGVLAILAIAAALRTRVRLPEAAAEADRILGTRERISTSVALGSGHAEDPLGFGDAIGHEAAAAAGAAPSGAVRRALPFRLPLRAGLSALLVLALLLVPLIPDRRAIAEANESPALKKEKERVQEALRRLDRKMARMEDLAKERKIPDIEKLAKKIRKESAHLAEERPSRAKAIARMGELERTVRKNTRRFAGLPKADGERETTATDRELRELAEAIRNFESANASELLRKFTSLANKLESQGMKGLTAAELKEFAKSAENLRKALEELSEKLGKDSEARQKLGDMYSPEQLKRLQEAMKQLSEALNSGEMSPEQLNQMMQQVRNYRDLQPTPEQIEQMLKQLEELAKRIEAGEALGQCKGAMGGLIPLPGFGGNPGPFPGTGGPGNRKGSGNDTGGPGTGRGGDPGTAKDDKPTRPELDPSKIGDEGTASFIRHVRRLPSPDENPGEYRELVRQASQEAEEAIRKGDIPRRYRDYVRRFFDSPEGE